MITEGQDLVRACLRRNQPGPYQLQAAINAVHADAPAAGATDWRQILALYDQLAAITPTPVVALNRCCRGRRGARSRRRARPARSGGPGRLPLVPRHPRGSAQPGGRPADAAAAYEAAIARTANGTERAFLTRQRDALAAPPGPQRPRIR